ncbi:GPI mannosyltransferase 2 [Nematocida sp. AWRm78]|nr:GPI mannosyltransferase 2 [Nematocida sp. AWRm79]KAI5185036.1 GPI mannosyltransferase 2 [Nematocida sp. AWRm78]
MIKVPILIWSLSRAVILSVSATSSFIIPHHDFSDILLHTESALSFLIRWDAIYFYNIAKYGYFSDNMTAFFPLYPILIQILMKYTFIPIITAGIIISNMAFLISSIILYNITNKHFNQSYAIRSCILFCFSPCSILYSTMYTEALFCMFILLAVESVLSHRGFSYIWVILASYTRSNGFIMSPLCFIDGFIKYSYTTGIIMMIMPIMAFMSVQIYWFINRFPYITVLPYSYVQAEYWEQGFLQFYKHSKNIPNIIVGLPFVILSCIITYNYVINEKYILQFMYNQGKERFLNIKQKIIQKITVFPNKEDTKISKYPNIEVFSFVRLFLHCILIFQIILSVFFIHMNMHFRFVSYNPVIYWELSKIFKKRGIWNLLFFGYICFGLSYAALYGAYFPPA